MNDQILELNVVTIIKIRLFVALGAIYQDRITKYTNILDDRKRRIL